MPVSAVAVDAVTPSAATIAAAISMTLRIYTPSAK
jgi:hypothetical protein